MSGENAYAGNNNVVPVGSIIYWAGLDSRMPSITNAGYMKCDGATLGTADYPELYKAIGRRWTAGGLPPSAFQVPDLTTYVPPGQPLEVSNLIIPGGATDAGTYVAATRTAFGSAVFSIADEANLPDGIALEYDTAAPNSGSFNYSAGGVDGANVYTNSVDGGRNTTGKDQAYVRSTFAQTTDGGYGSVPSVRFLSNPPDPVDVFADITNPTNYSAPSFNIVSLIKYANV